MFIVISDFVRLESLTELILFFKEQSGQVTTEVMDLKLHKYACQHCLKLYCMHVLLDKYFLSIVWGEGVESKVEITFHCSLSL